MRLNDDLLVGLACCAPASVDWIASAALVVLNAGGAIGLAEAAGLASTPARRRRALRDMHLTAAAAALGAGVPVTPLRLHKAVQDFRRACWPIWRNRSAPPSSANPAEIALFRAFRAGPIPGTPQGLGKILRENSFRN